MSAMNSQPDCLFCQIVAGQKPNHTLYEDEHTLAFLDIYPTVRGFSVVIPKQHSDFVWDMDPEDYQNLMSTVQKVGRRLREVLKPERVGVHIEGLHVSHSHVKVFPFGTTEEFHLKPDMSREPDHAALSQLAAKLKLV